MNDILRAQWCRDSTNGEEVLIDLDTNKEILLRIEGEIVLPLPKLRFSVSIPDTVAGPQYLEALRQVAIALVQEVELEQERMRHGSMEVL